MGTAFLSLVLQYMFLKETRETKLMANSEGTVFILLGAASHQPEETEHSMPSFRSQVLKPCFTENWTLLSTYFLNYIDPYFIFFKSITFLFSLKTVSVLCGYF